MSRVRLERDLDPIEARRRARRVAREMHHFKRRCPRDEKEAAEFEQRAQNEYVVEGRYEPGSRPGSVRRVWSIFRWERRDRGWELVPVADGFDFGEECVLRVRDILLGRTVVPTFGALGKSFTAAGGVLGAARAKQVEPVGTGRAPVEVLRDGPDRFVVRPSQAVLPAPAKPASPQIEVVSR